MEKIKNKNLAALVLAGSMALSSGSALGCNNNVNNSGYGNLLYSIMPVIENLDDMFNDSDGKVYVQFCGSLESINDLVMNPSDNITSSEGKEPIYNTFEDALKKISGCERYIVELDLHDAYHSGNISGGFDVRTNEKLGVGGVNRCLGSQTNLYRKDNFYTN